MENTLMEQKFPLKKFPWEKGDYQLNYFFINSTNSWEISRGTPEKYLNFPYLLVKIEGVLY